MKWTPDTHKISFIFNEDNNLVAFETTEEKYTGRDLKEIYDEVIAEHQEINDMCIGEDGAEIMSKESAMEIIRSNKNQNNGI